MPISLHSSPDGSRHLAGSRDHRLYLRRARLTESASNSGGRRGVGEWFLFRGIDDLVTSVRNIYNQTPGRPSFIHEAITNATGSQWAGMLIPLALDLTAGFVGGLSLSRGMTLIGRSGWLRGAGQASEGVRTDFGPRSIAQRSGRPVAQCLDMSHLYGVGGIPYSDAKLATLARYLEQRRVRLVVGLEAEAILQGDVAGFQALGNGSALLLFADLNPAAQVVWHELGHFIHWRRIGYEAYRALPRVVGNNVREQFVFDLLQQPSRWERLTADFRIFSDEYIRIRWGGIGR